MSAVVTRQRTFAKSLAAAVVLAVALAAPSGAFAATVALSGSTIAFTADSYEENLVLVTQDADEPGSPYVIRDTGTGATGPVVVADGDGAGGGCDASGATAICPSAGVAAISGRLGDEADSWTGSGLNIRVGVSGGDGNDVLAGGDRNDALDGGPGSDLLEGDAGDDVLVGGAGNDELIGGSGEDDFDAGDGDDSVNAEDGLRDVRISCGAGTDAVRLDPADTVGSDCETKQGPGATQGEAPRPQQTPIRDCDSANVRYKRTQFGEEFPHAVVTGTCRNMEGKPVLWGLRHRSGSPEEMQYRCKLRRDGDRAFYIFKVGRSEPLYRSSLRFSHGKPYDGPFPSGRYGAVLYLKRSDGSTNRVRVRFRLDWSKLPR